MTEFDGSTGSVLTDDHSSNGRPPADDDGGGMSALEQLRGIVEDREESEPWERVLPGGNIRITCGTDVPSSEFQRWQRAAMGATNRRGRRSGNVDVTRMDQFLLASTALIRCCEKVEVRNRKVAKASADGAWIIVTGRDGAPLALDDQEMLDTFRTPDARSLVTKLWGRDSDVITAGIELLEACGWVPGDEDPDDMDPI